ncbi:uroporphyrinogen-III synthase [Thalassovita taeanensis]|uniref:Uroporphyrinogen-III synthase n=1 Tax=Thalassovita taeanensis TaxID=657014 RepID=A0A1H9JGM9_9RHOB|nr:uroporphyrinogen-III synthase [Thalassovita taeanensis]SEQ86074.1 uroporphyrinogen-III synthase [Thalassovita taeanensis]
MAVTILLTRPEEDAARFAEAVRARLGAGVRIILSPVMRIVQGGDVPDAERLIFTSRHAVTAAGPGRGRRCYAVGEATGRAAQAAGFDVISAGGDAEALIRRILADGEVGPLLHLRGEHALGEIAGRLTAAGCETHEAVVYRQVETPLSEQAKMALKGENPVIVPLFSPRSARLFGAGHLGHAPVLVAAMSEQVAGALAGVPLAGLEVARTPDAEAMLDAVERLMAAATRLEG